MGLLLRLKLIVVILAAGYLSGCQGAEVASDLNQNQANRIVSVLSSNGISAVAKKEAGGRAKYNIVVDDNFYTQAVTVLDSKNLPAESQLSFAETIANQGILPGSRQMEQLRLDHALGLEVENLLENHPKIISAKIVIRQNFLQEGQQATVSVIVEEDAGNAPDKNEITQILERAVPGVSPENISISTYRPLVDTIRAEQVGMTNVNGKVIPLPLRSFFGLWRVPRDDYKGLSVAILCFLGVCIIVGGVIGYWLGYFHQAKILMDQETTALVPRVTRLEMKHAQVERGAKFDTVGGEWTQKD